MFDCEHEKKNKKKTKQTCAIQKKKKTSQGATFMTRKKWESVILDSFGVVAMP
jgi:hypothetical protein